jgi:hypothetical protein
MRCAAGVRRVIKDLKANVYTEAGMEILKKLFGGGGGSSSGGSVAGDRVGLYYYVRPNGCEEVVRVRVDRNNDLSLTDDSKGYWVRKGVRGVKCRQNVELELYYDSNRRLVNSELKGGELVDEAAYDAWMAQQATQA